MLIYKRRGRVSPVLTERFSDFSLDKPLYRGSIKDGRIVLISHIIKQNVREQVDGIKSGP
jgi:hypothetical protein